MLDPSSPANNCTFLSPHSRENGSDIILNNFFALGLDGDALVDMVDSLPKGRGFDTAGCCRVVVVTAHARSTNSPREN